MTPEQAAVLRAPFPPESIGKLPRVTCKKCSDRNMQCDRHSKESCAVCGNWISTQHIHLDFVGHAAVRDRLLQADPAWTWEPVAVDPTTGAPVVTAGGLWIRMTVLDVTRYGWGDGPDIKQMISDAIRNAAMTFGVALDLWSKEDLRHDDSPDQRENAPRSAQTRRAEQAPADQGHPHPHEDDPSDTHSPASSEATGPISQNRVQRLRARAAAVGNNNLVQQRAGEWNLPTIAKSSEKQLDLWAELLTTLEPIAAPEHV